MFGSLRTKLVLSHVGLVLLAMVLLGFYLIRTIDSFYLSNIQGRMRDTSAIITERIKPDLAAGNRDAVKKYLEEIGPTISVRVLVADADGMIVGASEPEEAGMIGRPGVSRGLSRALRSPEETVIEGVSRATSDLVYLLQPINVDGRRVGAMRLSYQLGDLHSQMEAIANLVLMGLAAAGVAALLVSLVLAHSLSAPARRVALAARLLAAGNLSHRVEMKGRDEIQEAGRAFDGLAERLEQLEKARHQLLGDISHDLHSSITGVVMGVEALQQGAADDPPMRSLLLEGLASHGDRLHRLANDLLEAARIESGRLQLEKGWVQPRELLSQVVSEFTAEAAQHGVVLELCDCPDLPRIWADGQRLVQALGNLVENAIRYTPAGGTVSLTGELGDGECLLTVQDQGPGIPKHDLEQLFHRFNRYDEARPGRLGLGLAIARGLAEAHGGRVLVETEVGEGSYFTLAIPLKGGQVEETTPAREVQAALPPALEG